MIAAKDALQLDSANPSKQDIADAQAMIEKLDQHVRKYMAFNGPTPYEVPFRQLSKTAAKIVAHVMKRFQWQVNANLVAEQPRFQGGEPIPHHWVLQLAPMVEIYDAFFADFNTSPHLDA